MVTQAYRIDAPKINTKDDHDQRCAHTPRYPQSQISNTTHIQIHWIVGTVYLTPIYSSWLFYQISILSSLLLSSQIPDPTQHRYAQHWWDGVYFFDLEVRILCSKLCLIPATLPYSVVGRQLQGFSWYISRADMAKAWPTYRVLSTIIW